MKFKLVLVGIAAGALALPVAANAAPHTHKVTGGGQVFLNSEDGTPTTSATGPGDTIAFQAFSNGESGDAWGQVNIIDRTEGAGGKGAHYKGEITCAFIAAPTDGMPGYAELRGTGSVKGEAPTTFQVRILDDGQGADTLDLVEFNRNYSDGDANTNDAEGCSDSGQDEEFTSSLARGNAKIHKVKGSESRSAQKASWTKALRLAGLR